MVLPEVQPGDRGVTITTEPRDGVLIPVGCPACHTPDGAHPMRLIEHMDPAGMTEQWRRSILECSHCGHGALIEITLASLDGQTH